MALLGEPEETQRHGVAVVVVPFPSQGHLNQLLHLSLHLSSHGLSVHYATSPSHILQAKSRLQGWHPNSLQSIHFHDLPLPPVSTPPPKPGALSSHLQPLREALLANLRAPLASLLRSLSAASPRLVVIYDSLVSLAAQEAMAFPNAEVYCFRTTPASFLLPFISASSQGKPDAILASFEGCFPPALVDFIITNHRLRESVAEAGILINTCRPVEGEFIDRLAREPSFQGKTLFAIGPLNPTILSREDLGRRQHGCLEWLDKQPPASVVYVSFGTLSTVPDEQIEELAVGLQRSRQRFIWVCREADRGFVHGESQLQRKLPAEYERMVEGVGMVVRGWAPQLEILAHPATGAFMSHCGWNSCMESISMGVPILAWPMQSDQPSNAVLVTQHLKVGIMAREWARRKEIVSSAGIEESIKKVMVYDGGKELRKRAKALAEAVREAMAKGGSSRAELDSFIARVSR
ncbi:putative cis-zeatin O-glucosyltransferase [Phoenix dactylifera]|uniref:Glycosyltransferase n=1 Tax=Phoenix dactylifera TaxID=42345 RepID=A0A8B7CUH0_PHODC|nr:putative cis-zeatin O-glucosyltransferase [Phoenix dactylifera]